MRARPPLYRRLLRFAPIAITALAIVRCATPQPPIPEKVTPTQDTSSKAWNPLVVSDPGGRVYVSYYASQEGRAYGLYVTRSLDGGATWLPEPVNLETPQTRGKRIGFHRLGTDRKGHVFATWSIESEVAAGRWRTVELRWRHSSDFGTTWPGPATAWIAQGIINYPTPLTGPDGEMMVIWKGREENTSGIFFSRTSQGSPDWLPAPIRIDSPEPGSVLEGEQQATPSEPEWPDISRDQEGRLFVAWQQERGPSMRIHFDRSLDLGATWLTPDIRVDTSKEEPSVSRIPKIATDGHGAVYVVWETFRGQQAAIHFNRSVDLGATWLGEDIRLGPERPTGVSAFAPQITSDRQGRVYVVWHEGFEGFDAIHFTRSVDRGTTWLLRPRQVDRHGSDATSESARLANDDDGHVYVAWGEQGKTTTSVLFNRSSDAGETWLPRPIRLDGGGTTTRARVPRMSVDGKGTINVVWSGNRGGKFDLFLNRSTDHGETWLAQEVQITR